MQDGGYEKCNGFSEKCKMANLKMPDGKFEKRKRADLKNARSQI